MQKSNYYLDRLDRYLRAVNSNRRNRDIAVGALMLYNLGSSIHPRKITRPLFRMLALLTYRLYIYYFTEKVCSLEQD